MANRLKMAEHQAIIALVRRNWSYRRIAAELGIDRETVSRHVKAAATESLGSPAEADRCGAPVDQVSDSGANATIVIAGSEKPVIALAAEESRSQQALVPVPDPNATIVIAGSDDGFAPVLAGRQSQCDPWRAAIVGGLERGLTAKRIWQDLRSEHGFGGDYQAVQRFVRRLKDATPLPFRRMESEAGAEAQVDFGKGAPLVSPDGKRRYPHLFRIVLSCSRKAYSEVVTRQTTEQFLRCIENAFIHFGGVPRTLVIDNLKAAVSKADWYDPELNPKVQAFATHYGTVVLPTRPYTPRHKGKVERGVGYAQSNALRGRTFASLAEQNRFLAEWETTVADRRVHGTTRKQVGSAFEELERPALLPLPPGRFPCFQEAQRVVNRDGHVEVDKSYYSAPPEFVGRTIWARWDGQVVRLFDPKLRQIAIHAKHEPGRFATDAKHIAPQKRGGIERGAAWWLDKANTIGGHAGLWAQELLKERGVHGLRALIGLVGLTRKHPPSSIEHACRVARSHGAARLRDIRNQAIGAARRSGPTPCRAAAVRVHRRAPPDPPPVGLLAADPKRL
jgi:transposase